MASEGAIFGMGNPLLDISANVPDEFLEKYGLKKNLACLAEEKHIPLYKEMVEKFEIEHSAGGATQNTIRIAQWMLGGKGHTTFVGCVGKDDDAATLRKCAEQAGVKVAYLEDSGTPTGVCAALITGDERTLVANISAANNYKIDHLESEDIWKLVEQAKIFYISGFFLTVSPPSAMKVAQHASAKSDKTFAMNLAAPFICEFFKEPLMAASQYWDYIFGNETEAEAFAKANDFGTTDIKEIALKTAALPKANEKARIVVFTQGAGNTIVCTEGKITEYPVHALTKEEIIDTNGAGDAFVAGFLAKLSIGCNIQECVKAGHWAASLIIRRSGVTVPPTCDYE